MNPFCPDCKPTVLLKTVKRLVYSKMNPNTGRSMYGLRRYWQCSKCKVKYHRGGQVIK